MCQAADRLAAFSGLLMVRHVDRSEAQRFILQMVVAFLAEDIGLLSHSLVGRLLDECHEAEDRYDLLGGLFEAMNTPGGVGGGRFEGADHLDGRLFSWPGVWLAPLRIRQPLRPRWRRRGDRANSRAQGRLATPCGGPGCPRGGGVVR